MLLDLLFGVEPKARVFAIDTHYLFPETYELWREVERRYDTTVEVFEGPSREELAATHGEQLWERNPDLYLAVAKVEPLVRALGGLDCWITGVRRDQSPTRADAPKLGWDAAHELWKANPLADWSDERLLDVHPRARAPLQPVARPRLRLDRRHALDDPRRRPRRPLGRQRPDRVRAAPRGDRRAGRDPLHLTHLDELEAEAVHIMREVAAELERPVLLFSGGKDSIVLLRLAEKAFRPGKFPFPVMHVDTGHNFPEVLEFRDRRVRRARRDARRRLRAGVDRPRARRRGDRPARLAQPAADDDAARRDRGAPLRRRHRRRAPRRGASAREGAHLQLPRRLRPVEPARAAAGALEPLQRAASAAASTSASSPSPTGPSSTSGSTSPASGWSCPRSTSRTSARSSGATGCSTPSASTSSGWTARSRSPNGCASGRSAT